MSKERTYKDYYNISIVSANGEIVPHMTLLRSIMRSCDIKTIMLRLASDGHVSGFEPKKVFAIFTYDSFADFIKDWSILNRRVLIEKTGFYI